LSALFGPLKSKAVQNYARKFTIPIDAIDFDFIIIDGDQLEIQPDNGHITYGPYLEGCAWDVEKHQLCESSPKVRLS